jgi:hypothetical protein
MVDARNRMCSDYVRPPIKGDRTEMHAMRCALACQAAWSEEHRSGGRKWQKEYEREGIITKIPLVNISTYVKNKPALKLSLKATAVLLLPHFLFIREGSRKETRGRTT